MSKNIQISSVLLMFKGATLGILNLKKNFLEQGRNFITENDVYKAPWNTIEINQSP